MASSHPISARIHFSVTFSCDLSAGVRLTFPLPRFQLGQRLFHRVQHGDLALRRVELEPREAGFDLVEPLEDAGVLRGLFWLRALEECHARIWSARGGVSIVTIVSGFHREAR